MYRRRFLQRFLCSITSLIMARNLPASTIITKTEKEGMLDEVSGFEKGGCDDFIANDGNWAACLTLATIAENIDKIVAPSPLCLFGDSRSGKTHLLNAFKNKVQRKHPDAICRSINASLILNAFEENDLTTTLRGTRELLSGCDVLLVDDIHVLIDSHRLINGTNEQLFLLDITESLIRRKKTVIFSHHASNYSEKGWLSSHVKNTLTGQKIILGNKSGVQIYGEKRLLLYM